MQAKENFRSIKIDENERGGWSSDRPKSDNDKPRAPRAPLPARVLAADTTLRFAAGDLLLIAGIDETVKPFVAAVDSPVMTNEQVRARLASSGVADADQNALASKLLASYISKRLASGKTTVLATGDFDQESIAVLSGLAKSAGKRTHLLVLDAGRKLVDDEATFKKLQELVALSRSGEVGSLGISSTVVLGRADARLVREVSFAPVRSIRR